jgi:hypothetical protein
METAITGIPSRDVSSTFLAGRLIEAKKDTLGLLVLKEQ